MKLQRLVLVVVLGLSLLGEVAWATEPAPSATPAPQVVHAARTVLDFSEVTLTAEVTRPAGSFLTARRRARFRSLVRLRNDFRGEIERTAERL